MSESRGSGNIDGSSFGIERYNPTHHRTALFSCGKASLDSYIQGTIARDEADRTAATYVLIDTTEPPMSRRVIGYFTLNSFSFPKRQGRRRDRDRNLGAYDPVPALLIGRLGLDSTFQGRGLGSVLIFEALHRALIVSGQVGAAVVMVHALDEDAAQFYEHQGFTRFRDKPNELYYPLRTFAAALPPSRSSDRPQGRLPFVDD